MVTKDEEKSVLSTRQSCIRNFRNWVAKSRARIDDSALCARYLRYYHPTSKAYLCVKGIFTHPRDIARDLLPSNLQIILSRASGSMDSNKVFRFERPEWLNSPNTRTAGVYLAGALVHQNTLTARRLANGVTDLIV